MRSKGVPMIGLNLLLAALLVQVTAAADQDQSSPAFDYKAPISAEAKGLYKQATDLIKQDKYQEALSLIRKTLSIAPNYRDAHLRSVDIRLGLGEPPEEIIKEYRAKMATDPRNPVYPLVLANGTFLVADQKEREQLFMKTTELGPDWGWGQFALASVYSYRKDTQKEMAAYRKAIELDPEVPLFQSSLAALLRRIGEYDEAIAIYERMLQRDPHQPGTYYGLWNTRLTKASASEEVKAEISREAQDLLTHEDQSPELLSMARDVYRRLLNDEDRAVATESKLKELYPDWVPSSGMRMITSRNLSGHPRRLILVGRRAVLYDRMRDASEREVASERLDALEALSNEPMDGALREHYHEQLFQAYQNAHDRVRMESAAEKLRMMDAGNIGPLGRVVQEMLDQKVQLQRALTLAQQLAEATSQFQPVKRPVHIGEAWWQQYFNEQKQQEGYSWSRAGALGQLGRVYYELGNYPEAERHLVQSLAVKESQEGAYWLGQTLARLGKTEEAAHRLIPVAVRGGSLEEKARAVLDELASLHPELGIKARLDEAEAAERERRRVEIVKSFADKPATDFELTDIHGQRHQLSKLQGKVVILNFWATWCGPCVAEMPLLAKLHEQFKAKGLEILALSTDQEKRLVNPFAEERKLPFPVLYAEKVDQAYDVKGIPKNVFIGRNGRVRLEKTGYGLGLEKEFTLIIEELLKEGPETVPASPKSP